MSSSVVRVDGLVSIPDQVQFLVIAEQEPRSRKVEIRPIHHRQLHGFPVKGDACVDVRDVQGNVIELKSFHPIRP
jgi:hypothetical protein